LVKIAERKEYGSLIGKKKYKFKKRPIFIEI
jgi:hypothetical protein